jgi:hypothetical protein
MATFKAPSPLLGTWELVSFWWRLPSGEVTQPWGAHPAGRITYDADGYVTALLMHELRNEADGHCSSADLQADFSAYFGTYTVDTDRLVITHQVAASLSATHASGEITRNYELKDDALTLSFIRPRDGVPVTYSLVWKHISTPRHTRHGDIGP